MSRSSRSKHTHIFAAVCLSVVAIVALIPLMASASSTGIKAKSAKKSLTTAKVIALIKQHAGTGAVGPAGAAGPAGATGSAGASGPTDTGAQILAKLAPEDGAGSALDADLLDGFSSSDFLLSGSTAAGDLTGTYPSPTIDAGAVTTLKLGDLQVTIPKLSFDPATQAELDALAAAGTLNQGSNPVDWTKLKSVPAAFADGTDDGGSPTGSAGGDLTGTYPDPTIGTGKVTDTNVAGANKDGLSGVPSLRTLGTGAQQAAGGNDPRFSDSRTPTGSAGGDLTGSYPNPTIATGAVTDGKVATANIDGSTGTPSLRTLGTGAQQAAAGDDSRLSNSRAPTGAAGGDLLNSSYPNPELNFGVVTATEVAFANKDGLAGVPSFRTLGTGAQQAAAGNDSRLSDSRTPTGTAGGALNGTYPNPDLDVSGGTFNATTCTNGEAVKALSAAAALTCAPGIFSSGSNVAAGHKFPSLSVGDDNTALGQGALSAISAGDNNTAVGSLALLSNTNGANNSALGKEALRSNTSGTENSAVGPFALFMNTTGSENAAFGVSALQSNTTATRNSAVGDDALKSNTTGTENTAVGAGALDANTGGGASDNSALGEDALGANTTGADNSALGESALLNNTTGVQNTALGGGALAANTVGLNNSAVGTGALSGSTGSANSALGFHAGSALTTGDNNLDIANNGVAGESATTRIGFFQTRAFMAGVRGVSTGVGDAIPVMIDSVGQLGTVSSSRTVKTDIQALRSVEALMDLNPVSFRYREGPPELHYGLIAEQVARVLPTLAVYDHEGLPETVQYQELPALLLAKVQAQQREIDALETQNDRIDDLEAKVAELMRASEGR